MSVCVHFITCIYSLTWVGLIVFFIIPFEIYVTIKFYKYRFHPGIQTRYPMVIIASAIFAMLHSLICESFYYLQSGVSLDVLNTSPAIFSSHIIFPPFLLMMFIMVSFRVYLIHYNTKYAISQSTLDWQLLLSDSVPSDDFYSRNRATYGNWRYVIRYFIFYFIIASIVDITASTFEHPEILNMSHAISKYIYVFCLLLVIIFSAYLFFKTPKFEDIYFVREELKYLIFLLSFCVMLYILASVFASDEFPIFEEISTTAITLATFGQVVISEYIILNKMMKHDDSGYDYGRSTFMLPGLPQKHSSQKKAKFIAPSILFNVLLATPVGIDLFVKHLRSEFCVENLLSLIELVQWIYFATNKELDSFNIAPLEKIEFDLCSIIPISSANQHYDNDTNDCKFKWEQPLTIIYQKYIHYSAELQVNLPYEIMTAWSSLMYLLKMKQELRNKTYIFKHQPMPIKPVTLINKLSFSFWGKSSNKSSKRTVAVNMHTIHESKNVEVDEPNINPLIDNINWFLEKKSSTKTKSKQNIDSKHMYNNNRLTVDASDGSVALETAHLTVSDGSAPPQLRQMQPGESTEFDSIDDVDQLVIVDDDYRLYDSTRTATLSKTKVCKDPEISNCSTLRTNTNRTNSSRTDTNRTASKRAVSFRFDTNDRTTGRNTDSLKLPPLKLKNDKSVINSVKTSFHKLSKLMRKTSGKSNSLRKNKVDEVEKINNLYIKEWEEVERAKSLKLNEFVSLTCRSIHIILLLNYQSVSRFKRSKSYAEFVHSVNLQSLIEKYGKKGVF